MTFKGPYHPTFSMVLQISRTYWMKLPKYYSIRKVELFCKRYFFSYRCLLLHILYHLEMLVLILTQGFRDGDCHLSLCLCVGGNEAKPKPHATCAKVCTQSHQLQTDVRSFRHYMCNVGSTAWTGHFYNLHTSALPTCSLDLWPWWRCEIAPV